jgi:U3 small nucleolar RNA-associated protein 23
MVYIKRSVMIMEPMSEQSEGVRLGVEKGKLRGGVKPGMASVKRKREDDEENVNGGEKAGEEKEKKKRKIPGPKGPNPLSVKKPKKPATPAEEEGAKERPTTSRKVKTIPEKATDTLDAVGGAGNDSKRKRKRKHKPPTEKGPDALVTGGNAGDESS